MSASSQGKQYQPFAVEPLDNKEQQNTNLQVETAESNTSSQNQQIKHQEIQCKL